MTRTITKTPPIPVRLSEADLCSWIGAAAPGHRIEYHRGSLARDICPQVSRLPEAARGELVRVARRARWGLEAGPLNLVQHRHGEDDYSYVAIVRRKPKMTPLSLASLDPGEATDHPTPRRAGRSAPVALVASDAAHEPSTFRSVTDHPRAR